MLTQVVSVVLFSVLSITVVSFAKNYIPEKLDINFGFMAFIGVAVTCAYYYYFCTILNFSEIFISIPIALTLGFCVLHPVIALSNLVCYLILRPWELLEREDLAVLPRTFLLLFIISLILNFYQTGRLRINFGKQQLLIIALGLWVFLSTVFTGNASNLQSYYFENYFKSIVVAIFIFQAIRTEEDYDLLSNSLVTSVFGLALFALVYTYFIAHTERLEGRGAVSNTNDLAAMLILVVPLSLKSILRRKFVAHEWVFSLALILTLALGVYKAQSRASYIAILFMGITYFIYVFRARKKMILTMIGVTIVSLGVLSQLNLGRDTGDLEESKQNRIGYWKAGMAMAVRHPLLGVGYTEYPRNFGVYGVANLTEGAHRTAHSSWILLISEAGVPALTLMLVLFFQAAVRAWALFPKAPELLLMIVGYGVCMTFLSHSYTLYPYIILGMVFTYPYKEPALQPVGDSNENPVA